jgi:hypothetical protein
MVIIVATVAPVTMVVPLRRGRSAGYSQSAERQCYSENFQEFHSIEFSICYKLNSNNGQRFKADLFIEVTD